ncbi:MAG: single-stranded-DNA-specific exonuclease RecJ [Bauldia litoralis]|uniref:single-stranded-DNA-specific exonuclease RecJ n=4 Tax=Bauldia litoralis TaxID=665467 RepID=UPI0032991231
MLQTLNTSQDRRAFLGVEQSLTGRRWAERLDGEAARVAQAMAQRHGISDIVARVLAGRGVATDDAPDFLDPALKRLMPDPSLLTDMDAAAARIADAITGGEAIAIFGDYDVDGATSSALMLRFLRAAGCDATVYIPDRIFEGYGPNPEAMGKLAEGGAKLVICVDCGSTSFEALAEARRLGLGVVVIDHHQVGAELPPAEAVVNPNRQDDLSGLGHLAAVGVTFLTVVAVNRVLRARGFFNGRAAPDLLQWLDLVALGTVCDVVPLIGLNRAFVTKGLLAMGRRENRGLAALADVARLGGPPSPYHLGFMLGPRINAGGRIGDAALGARLLATDDAEASATIAAELDRLNRERQVLETAMLEEAVAEAEAEIGAGPGPAVLVTASDRWHPGVVGLIASRLKDRFQRPSLAIALQPNGLGAGSGRSVAGVDLGRAVRRAVDQGIAVKGGGHAMAAGLTIERGRLADLRAFLSAEAARAGGAEPMGSLSIDAALAATGATIDMIGLIGRAGPFGAGHAEPVFAFPGHQVGYVETVGNGHVRASLKSPDGTALKAMAFRAADTDLGRALLDSRGQALHVAGSLSADHWQGRSQPSLRIIDAAPP